MKKLGILKLVLLVSLLSFTIFSCNENPMDDDFTLKNQSNIIEEKTLIILGEQYPNPYSVSNMLNAYQYLKNNGENIGNLNITTTDLYVRFLPQDTTQYNFLNNDTTLILFDYPLDYEIEKFGDYYQDPNIEEGNYTWLYTTVPINYQFNPLGKASRRHGGDSQCCRGCLPGDPVRLPGTDVDPHVYNDPHRGNDSHTDSVGCGCHYGHRWRFVATVPVAYYFLLVQSTEITF